MSDIFGGEEVELTPEPEAEPEQQAEAPPESSEEAEPVGQDSTVPTAALNESRAQLRQTQAELAQMRDQMAKFESIRGELDDLRGSKQAAEAENEFNTDPLGSLQKQMSALDEKITTQQETDRQNAVQEQQGQQLFTSIASQVNEFKATVPDYDDALAHVLDTRKEELIAMGVPEQDAQSRISMEAQEIAMSAMRSGQNPGKVVYDLARVRGYAAKKTSKKLATVEKGQKASSSLSGTSGQAEGADFSLSEIDSMSDEQFDAWWDKEMKPTNH